MISCGLYALYCLEISCYQTCVDCLLIGWLVLMIVDCLLYSVGADAVVLLGLMVVICLFDWFVLMCCGFGLMSLCVYFG